MSEKLSTVILKVDLQCSKCRKKIEDTLCKLQERYDNIRSIVYDEKSNMVAITGTFEPKKLIKKICSKACKAIQDIQLVNPIPPKPADPPPQEHKPDPSPPEPEPTPAPPAEPEPAPPAPEPAPPAPAEPEPTPEPEPQAAPEPEPEPEPEPQKPDPPPKKVEPEPPKAEPVTKPAEPAYPYPRPVWSPGPGCCCCRPWYEAYQGGGGCRSCSCGCAFGPINNFYPPPPPPQQQPTVVYTYGGPYPCYDGPKTCEFICEDQPSTCGIM